MAKPMKIICKKLSSGKCQVKFETSINNCHYHGYVLTNPEEKLRDVMATINYQLKYQDILNHHLYHIGQPHKINFLLYKVASS